jgi:hypothetical protein
MGKNRPRYRPRYRPTYSPEGGRTDKFLGYANDLDVWNDPKSFEIFIVGPESRLIRPDSRCNFDALDVEDGNLVGRTTQNDLHIDVHDMCLIYALCVEHGVFKENTNEPK